MSESKHTPEPWEFGYGQTREFGMCLGIGLNSAPDWHVVAVVSPADSVNHADEANARRIVACVNACAGVDTECLEVAPIGIFASKYGSPGYIDQLEKQRDELLAENEQLRKDAERYRVLRDSEYQLDEDDPSVSDSFFNQYFGEELDAAVDELKSRFDSAIASVKELK